MLDPSCPIVPNYRAANGSTGPIRVKVIIVFSAVKVIANGYYRVFRVVTFQSAPFHAGFPKGKPT